MASSPGLVGSADADSSAAALVVSVAKAVVRFDTLACKFATGFEGRNNHVLKPLAERVKLLSESLRLSILMERGSEETAEASTELLLSMRQLHLLGKTSRLHPSYQTLLRLGLGLVEKIVKGLQDLGPVRHADGHPTATPTP